MNYLQGLICETAEQAARDWFLRQGDNLFASFYVFYKKPEGDEKICTLKIATEKPQSATWDYLLLERISPAWTEIGFVARLVGAMWSLPILNPAIKYI